jgi:uncharacterized protein (DUF1499 family)
VKVVWFIATLVVVLATLLFLAGRLGLLQGVPPHDLGVKNGRLKPPAPTPNSVSSQTQLYPGHPQAQYAAIAPLDYQGDAQAAMAKLVRVVQAQPDTVIVSHTDDYLYAQSSTRLLRFTDDIEFWLDTRQRTIQVRSASRMGRYDLGVNRQRIETIRVQFNAL